MAGPHPGHRRFRGLELRDRTRQDT